MASPKNKKVLIVEDDEHWQEIYRVYLAKYGMQILSAYSLHDAEELAASHPDVAAVVMDGQLGKADIENATAFVRDMRIRGFKGPMIAASADATHCITLLSAGCDYEIGGNKELTVPLLTNALRIRA